MTSFLRGTRGKEKESLSDWLKLGGICGAFLATLMTLLPPGSALGQELEGFKDTLSLLDAWIADRAASRGQPWLVDWCGSWRFVDLIGKSGHIRTIPMPGWVRQLLDDWSSAAGISSGRLFRRVHRTGRIWGEGLTEKAVWHVVKEFADKIGITKLAPHDLRSYADLGMRGERARGSAMRLAVSWSKSSFCWAMFPCRRPSGTWAASSESARP